MEILCLLCALFIWLPLFVILCIYGSNHWTERQYFWRCQIVALFAMYFITTITGHLLEMLYE